MNGAEVALRLLVGTLFIATNAFFVATEFALTRVRQYDQSEFETPGLQRAWNMTEDLEIYLTSCQVGISATSIAVGIIAEPALSLLFAPVFENTVLASVGAASIIAFVLLNLVHMTHGEQTPTYLGVERTKSVARYGATPLYWFTKLIFPVIFLGDLIAKLTLRLFGIEMTGAWLETESERVRTRADLRHRLTSLLRQGELPTERTEEIINMFTIGEIPVSDIMTAVDDVVFLSTAVSVEENLDRIGTNIHTRYPLIGDEPEAFLGIVYVPTVVDSIDELRAGDVTLEDLAVSPMTIDADTHVSEAVDQFQRERQELALVLEDGEVVGLITATDALEAVVGDIQDPLEEDIHGRATPH